MLTPLVTLLSSVLTHARRPLPFLFPKIYNSFLCGHGQIPAEAATIPPDVVCTFSCGGVDSNSSPLLASLSSLLSLPTGARIADSFLTTLVRLCRLEDVPLTVLARVGYRSTGAAADVDGTDEVGEACTGVW